MLRGVRYRGVFLVELRPLRETSNGGTVKIGTAEDPWSLGKGMGGVDLAPLCREPQGARRDTGDGRGLTEVEPRLASIRRLPVDRNAVV